MKVSVWVGVTMLVALAGCKRRPDVDPRVYQLEERVRGLETRVGDECGRSAVLAQRLTRFKRSLAASRAEISALTKSRLKADDMENVRKALRGFDVASAEFDQLQKLAKKQAKNCAPVAPDFDG